MALERYAGAALGVPSIVSLLSPSSTIDHKELLDARSNQEVAGKLAESKFNQIGLGNVGKTVATRLGVNTDIALAELGIKAREREAKRANENAWKNIALGFGLDMLDGLGSGGGNFEYGKTQIGAGGGEVGGYGTLGPNYGIYQGG